MAIIISNDHELLDFFSTTEDSLQTMGLYVRSYKKSSRCGS